MCVGQSDTYLTKKQTPRMILYFVLTDIHAVYFFHKTKIYKKKQIHLKPAGDTFLRVRCRIVEMSLLIALDSCYHTCFCCKLQAHYVYKSACLCNFNSLYLQYV